MENLDALEARSPAPDHRAIGRALGLFHVPRLAQGQVFWEPSGLILLRELEAFVSRLVGEHGYQEVRSPLLWREELWQRSGHAEKFDGLYRADGGLALKPVACPAHCAYYLRRPRTLAELPLRLAELGCCHRNEQSGELQGLLRLRGFVQDDAHIFAAPEQVAAEIAGCLRLAEAVYGHFGLEADYELSLRPAVRHARMRSGTEPRMTCGGRSTRQVWPRSSGREREPSTARRLTCTCATRWADAGSSAPSRSTTCCRSGSTSATGAQHRPMRAGRS